MVAAAVAASVIMSGVSASDTVCRCVFRTWATSVSAVAVAVAAAVADAVCCMESRKMLRGLGGTGGVGEAVSVDRSSRAVVSGGVPWGSNGTGVVVSIDG